MLSQHFAAHFAYQVKKKKKNLKKKEKKNNFDSTWLVWAC